MHRKVCLFTLLVTFTVHAHSVSAMQATLGRQMDDAIKMMRSAGNNEPATIIAMLNAGAQGYFTAGDLDNAIDRIDQAISLAEKMSTARFIHLATHGLLESENAFTQGYLSAIALAPSKGEDGFLTVRETRRMNLVAELVVLSACDTGRGVITGDGVIGLTQGYVSAGVPSVVVSLWPVSDQATAVSMSYFYQAMLKGADKATALRAAMLKTHEQFPSPKLWAPFTICGSAD